MFVWHINIQNTIFANMNMMVKPQIAIITPNTLTGIGLRNIIEKMMPGADAFLFESVETLQSEDRGQFFHYFISSHALMSNSAYFMERLHKTIVLVHGNEIGLLPKQFHTLNVCKTEDILVRNVLKLAEMAHGARHPKVVQQAQQTDNTDILSKREIEVLRLVVSGMINKEIATELNVHLSTIISHRKNITAKLNIKSVSGLTIYAVTHGIIRAEEI